MSMLKKIFSYIGIGLLNLAVVYISMLNLMKVYIHSLAGNFPGFLMGLDPFLRFWILNIIVFMSTIAILVVLPVLLTGTMILLVRKMNE